MTPLRWYLAAVGLVAGIVGIIFLVGAPMWARDSSGTSVRCGTAVKRDEQAWEDYRHKQAVEELAFGNATPRPPDCDAPIAQRRLWAISLAVAGFVLAGGVAAARREGD